MYLVALTLLDGGHINEKRRHIESTCIYLFFILDGFICINVFMQSIHNSAEDIPRRRGKISLSHKNKKK